MNYISIEIDAESLRKALENQNQYLVIFFTEYTRKALDDAAMYAYNLWAGYLNHETKLDGIEFFKGSQRFIPSLGVERIGNFQRRVYSKSSALEKRANEGIKPVEFDMKKTHPFGRKSRVSKDGESTYLIIPFKWGTSKGKSNRFNNLIPQKNYRSVIKGLELSSRRSTTHNEINARGENIERSEYNWGGRLTEDTAWNDYSKGLVKMKDIRGSKYFTFRIISTKSKPNSWIYKRKGEDPIDILGALKKTAQPVIERMIQEGIKKDIDVL